MGQKFWCDEWRSPGVPRNVRRGPCSPGSREIFSPCWIAWGSNTSVLFLLVVSVLVNFLHFQLAVSFSWTISFQRQDLTTLVTNWLTNILSRGYDNPHWSAARWKLATWSMQDSATVFLFPWTREGSQPVHQLCFATRICWTIRQALKVIWTLGLSVQVNSDGTKCLDFLRKKQPVFQWKWL